MADLLTVKVDVQGLDEVKEIIRDALDRAEKAEAKLQKYRWHDLRKDPEDIPMKHMNWDVITGTMKVCYNAPRILYMDSKKQVTEHAQGVNGKYTSLISHFEIIAWKFLEPLKEDE